MAITMYAAVIDTLRFADRLKAAGFNDPQAEGLARALGVELAESMITRRDLDTAVQSLRTTIEILDAKFDSRFEAVDARFESLDSRFESQDSRFEAVDSRFESLDSRFEAVDSRFESLDSRFEAVDSQFESLDSQFKALDAKIEAQHREFSGKFNVLFTTMALGFTLVIGLIGYSLFAMRSTEPGPAAAAVGYDTVAPQAGLTDRAAPAARTTRGRGW